MSRTDCQIKSKERVKKHGEVFTGRRQVSEMLDLVKSESYQIDSKFLDPACGNGNFLSEILSRKLKTALVQEYPSKKLLVGIVLAATSIYGIDIQMDNVLECRSRLLEQIETAILAETRQEMPSEVRYAIRFILQRNILQGDFLTCSNARGRPLTVSEWSLDPDGCLSRRVYRLKELMDEERDALPCGKFKYVWLKTR